MKNKYTHENIVGTCWSSEKDYGQEHQVLFVETGSLYLIANVETGHVTEECAFHDFEALISELNSPNWFKY